MRILKFEFDKTDNDMASTRRTSLIVHQIRELYNEIFTIQIVFALANCISLIYVGKCAEMAWLENLSDLSLCLELGKMCIALFLPYITFVSKGSTFPKRRKIRTLEYLFFRRKLTVDEMKLIFNI